MPRLFKSIFLICFLLFFCSPIAFAEEEITITTYYPSPYGSYNQLQTNALGIGDNNGNGSLDSGDVPNPAANPGDLWIKGNVGIGTGTKALAYKLDVNGGLRLGTLNFRVPGGDSGQSNNYYGIYQESGAWVHPYPDLRIQYHTGIKYDAYYGYGGHRFYTGYDGTGNPAGLTFSVGDGDQNVRVANTLITGGLQMASGAVDNYVLTSDANGVASWGATSGIQRRKFPSPIVNQWTNESNIDDGTSAYASADDPWGPPGKVVTYDLGALKNLILGVDTETWTECGTITISLQYSYDNSNWYQGAALANAGRTAMQMSVLARYVRITASHNGFRCFYFPPTTARVYEASLFY